MQPAFPAASQDQAAVQSRHKVGAFLTLAGGGIDTLSDLLIFLLKEAFITTLSACSTEAIEHLHWSLAHITHVLWDPLCLCSFDCRLQEFVILLLS